MTDRLPPCERWAEAVSLLAAGCLAADEEQDARQHLEACPACRERFEQLVVVCHSLDAARQPDRPLGALIAARAMSEIGLDAQRSSAPRPRRWRLTAGLAIAASLLVALVLRVVLVSVPHAPELVGHPPAKRVPTRVVRQPLVEQPQPQPLPTLLAYERALARSDADLDRLLDVESRRLVGLSIHESRLSLIKELVP